MFDFCDLLPLLIRKFIFIFVKRMKKGVFATFRQHPGRQVRFSKHPSLPFLAKDVGTGTTLNGLVLS